MAKMPRKRSCALWWQKVWLRHLAELGGRFKAFCDNGCTSAPRYENRTSISIVTGWCTKREAHIDVLRVLHQHADIPAQLSDLN
jgi:plasmid stabilization system protein ParE